MNRLLLAVTLLVAMVTSGLAGTVEQRLLASLQAQGYVVVEQSYTLLGRLRIIAHNGTTRRDILVNPGTGEVLRDISVADHEDPLAPPEVAAEFDEAGLLPEVPSELDLSAPQVLPPLSLPVDPAPPPEVPPEILPEVPPEIMPEVRPEISPEIMPETLPESAPADEPEWQGDRDRFDGADLAPIIWQPDPVSPDQNQDQDQDH